MKQRVVFSYKKFLSRLLIFVVSALSVVGVFYSAYYSAYEGFVSAVDQCGAKYEQVVLSFPNLKDIISEFFGKEKEPEKDDRQIMVYPGGFPLGFTMECQGVVVVSIGEVLTENGMENLLKNKNVKVGDVIHSVNGEIITSANQMQLLLNKTEDENVYLELYRGSEIIKEVVQKKRE